MESQLKRVAEQFSRKEITRRKFLAFMAAGGATMLTAACSKSISSITSALISPTTSAQNTTMTTTATTTIATTTSITTETTSAVPTTSTVSTSNTTSAAKEGSYQPVLSAFREMENSPCELF